MNNKFFNKNDNISKELNKIRQSAASNWKRHNGIASTPPPPPPLTESPISLNEIENKLETEDINYKRY